MKLLCCQNLFSSSTAWFTAVAKGSAPCGMAMVPSHETVDLLRSPGAVKSTWGGEVEDELNGVETRAGKGQHEARKGTALVANLLSLFLAQPSHLGGMGFTPGKGTKVP